MCWEVLRVERLRDSRFFDGRSRSRFIIISKVLRMAGGFKGRGIHFFETPSLGPRSSLDENARFQGNGRAWKSYTTGAGGCSRDCGYDFPHSCLKFCLVLIATQLDLERRPKLITPPNPSSPHPLHSQLRC